MAATDAAARARHEVMMFENYLDVIVSLHKDAWSPWDWNEVANAPPPVPMQEHERAAVAALHAYQPSILDRATGKDKVVRSQLEAAIMTARQQDAALHQQQYAQWEWYRRVGHGVLQGDPNAYRAVLEHLLPFEELVQLGMSSVGLKSNAAWYVEAEAAVGDEEIVPTEERKLLASGKMTVKEMPKAKYWGLYQDYVCSAALRIARELFALLSVNVVLVHITRMTLNPATGRDEQVPLISVQFDRARFSRLNFDRLDASDAVSTFGPQMKFKKTTGFSAVERLAPANNMTSA